MRCQAKTTHGTQCKKPGWATWPLCKGHLAQASDELFEATHGPNAVPWAVITRPEPEEHEEVE